MRITVFTSNNSRHNYYINLLANYCDELFVVQECMTKFPGKLDGHYSKSKIVEEYFSLVQNAQKKIFTDDYIKFNKKCKINYLSMQMGDLSYYGLNNLKEFLKSNLYLVFGSSYIKGDLINFLVKKKAINIHAGISPYYRGCDCNFWALYEENFDLVGTTIHYLTKGLDSGPILYHAGSEYHNDPFIYSMSTIKSAFISIAKKIENEEIFNLKPLVQNKSLELKYSKKKDFNDKIIRYFLNNFKKMKIQNCKLKREKLTNAYIFPKKNFFKNLYN